MNDRTVTVKLRMAVRDYIAGGNQAVAMNRQLQASQAALGNSAKQTSADMDLLGRTTQAQAARMSRGLLMGAAGLSAFGAAGGAVKALPPLLYAAATAAAALPVSVLGAAAGIGVAVTATRGLGDAIKELDKNSKQSPFAKLAPEAKAFVYQIAQSKGLMQDLQQDLQGRFFAGTAAGLNLLVTKSLPQVTGGLEKIADDWSGLFAELALATNQPEVISAFNTITDSADDFFDGVVDRVRPTAAAIATLVESTDPVARAFGEGLLGWVDRFNAAVARAESNGSLAELFEAGTHAAQELMSITGSIFSITGMVVREAAASNDATASAGESLRSYVESGRAAGDVAGIVHTLTTAWEGLRDVLGPIGALVRDALADPATAQSVATFFSFLAAGSQTVASLLQVLLALNNMTGGTLLALAGLVLVSTKLAGAIGLATAAAARGAATLGAYGAAAGRAGTMMTGMVGTLGKVAGGFFALEIAHQVFDMFQDSAADVDALDASLRKLADSGQYVGEISRVFDKGWGDIEAQKNMVNSDNWFTGILKGAEQTLPVVGDIAELFGSPTWSNSKSNFESLDAAFVRYAQSTNDVAGATKIWNEIQKRSNSDQLEMQKLLPGASAEMARLQAAAHTAGDAQARLADRTKLLQAPLDEAVTAGRDLLGVFTELNGGAMGFAQAEIAAEKSLRALKKSLDDNGKSFDVHKEKGLANKEALLGYLETAAKAGQARMDETGSVEKGAAVYERYVQQLRSSLAAQGMAAPAIEALISQYGQMPASLEAAAAAATNLNGRLNSIPKGAKFTFNGDSVVDGQGRVLELKNGIKGLPAGKTFTFNGKSLVDGKGKVYELKSAIQSLPPGKTIKVTAITGGADAQIQAIKDSLARLNGKTITITARTQIPAGMSVRQLMNAHGGVYVPRQRGGVTVRAAEQGLLQPMIAPPGTRYQWAEPETGGELFLPRKGINRARGRQLREGGADWYGMDVVPRRSGGITLAAAAGLVNVAPKEVVAAAPDPGPKATRLDFAEAYLRARDAVKSLSTSLKENGRSFSTATAKGRENRSALYSGIRAAQDAAKTKFEETGSVKAANRVYDEYIARLKATLKQQKVNSATIKSLLALAQRPTYDVPKAEPKPPPAPTNSLSNIALARAKMATYGGLAELQDQLSLNQVDVSMKTDVGRENLGNIISFLETAASMAQARYEQTKNAKTATADYEAQVKALRELLAKSGYAKATIDSLIKSYGRITLVPPTSNRYGGVYMAANGLARLDEARIFSGSRTMYGFAEPETGGELFLPRVGDRQRGRDLLSIGAGWYGGQFTAGGASTSTSSYDYSTHLVVQPRTYNPSPSELIGYQRELDARARVGRPR